MILVAGLTPAWQQVLLFDSFTPGAVNRAREVHWCASGKVLNAARALHHLGVPCRALAVVDGMTGDAIRDDFERLGVAARWVEGAAPTRVCTTVLDAAGPTVAADKVGRLLPGVVDRQGVEGLVGNVVVTRL